MSVNQNRALYKKANNGRHQRLMLIRELYPPYCDGEHTWKHSKFPNHKARSYKTWKYNRKTQWKENMKKERVFVVGDIHGWLEPLIELLERVKFDNEKDKLILLGDLCDRGPYTWEVIEFLLTIKNLVFIIGNHDYCFREYLNGNVNYIQWTRDFGKATIKSYESHDWENLEIHKKFINSAIPYHLENNMVFVHGGFDRYRYIKNQHESILCHDRQLINDVMNGRDEKIYTLDNFDKIVIGHTPTLCWNVGDEKLNGKLVFVMSIDNPNFQPIIKSSVYLLDTGCAKGGPLTLYDVYDNKYYQSKYKYKYGNIIKE